MPDQVLVAIDSSPQAFAALRHALARFADANISVIHVNDPRAWWYGGVSEEGYYSEDAFERSQQTTTELLDQASSLAEKYGQEISTATEVGHPANTIVRYAEEHDVDHIVIGSHGRTGLSRFLLGSVAETVAKRAPVSVTVIREADPENDQLAVDASR